MFRGAMTALVTPFREGTLDEEAFRKHINWQIEQGIHGLVPCGTTGESATMSHDEHCRVIDITVDEANGRVPVVAGTGSNNTMEAVQLTRYAKEAGADAALLITPYYNKPSQEGLVAHFAKVAEEAKFPIIAYNVPSRTGVNMLPATVGRLCEIPEVVGIKEATGSLMQVSEVIAACAGDFSVLSGDDFTTLPLLAVGGRGVISVTSNIAPAEMAEMVEAFAVGDLAKARALHYALFPLMEAMFYDTNPVPVKTALEMMGRMNGSVRMPLCQMSDDNRARLESALRAYGLVGGDA